MIIYRCFQSGALTITRHENKDKSIYNYRKKNKINDCRLKFYKWLTNVQQISLLLYKQPLIFSLFLVYFCIFLVFKHIGFYIYFTNLNLRGICLKSISFLLQLGYSLTLTMPFFIQLSSVGRDIQSNSHVFVLFFKK